MRKLVEGIVLSILVIVSLCCSDLAMAQNNGAEIPECKETSVLVLDKDASQFFNLSSSKDFDFGAKWICYNLDDPAEKTSRLYDGDNLLGIVNQKIFFYKLAMDRSHRYDWYAVVWVIQVIPGHVACDNGWHVADVRNWVDGDLYRSYIHLIDYGPYSTQGTTTVTYHIGVEANEEGAAVSASFSVSYSIKDIDVHDQSDFSENLAKWWHDVNEDTVGWNKVIVLKPGMVFRVPQSKDLKLRFVTKVTFREYITIVPHDIDKVIYFDFSSVRCNFRPFTPSKPSGPTTGMEGESYEFSTRTVDPDWDKVKYLFDWGDGKSTTTQYLDSEALAEASHKWVDDNTEEDVFSIKVKAIDENGAKSEWSDIHSITIKEKDCLCSVPSTEIYKEFSASPHALSWWRIIIQMLFEWTEEHLRPMLHELYSRVSA